MAEEITFDSEELFGIENILESSEKIFNDDIKKDLSNDFTSLLDLGFTGVSVVQNQTSTLSTNHDSFTKALKNHDQNITSLESSIDEKIKAMIDNKEIDDNNDASEVEELIDVDLDDIEKGQTISDEQLTSLVSEFTYTSKVGILKNILSYDVSNITSLITIPENSNILVYELRQMLYDDVTDINAKATDNEKHIQKEFINSLASEETNPFKDIEEDTFLKGLPYYKRIAELNNMDAGDLLVDKENEKLLKDCIEHIYNHTSVNGLSESDINSVKNYVNQIAKENNMSANELFENSSTISLLKGGINDEVTS